MKSDLRVQVTSGRDRGVFAGRSFAPGELLEDVPVIVIPSEQWSSIEGTVLYDYTFSFGLDFEHAAIALGHGSLYNHSEDANAEFETLWEERRIRFNAVRAIAPGDEITIDYRQGNPEAELWFEVKP